MSFAICLLGEIGSRSEPRHELEFDFEGIVGPHAPESITALYIFKQTLQFTVNPYFLSELRGEGSRN